MWQLMSFPFFFISSYYLCLFFFPPFFPRMNISTVAFRCIVFFSFFSPRIVICLIFFIFPLAVRTIPHEHRLKKQQQTKEEQCCPGSSPLPSPSSPDPAPHSAPAPPQQSSRPEIWKQHLKVAMNQTDYLTADSFQFSVTHFVLLFLFVYFTWEKKKNISDALKKEYIYYYYCSRRIPHPTKVPPGTVSKLLNKKKKKKRGNSFCGTPKCGNSARLRFKSSMVVIVTVLKLFAIHCVFCVRGLAREIFFFFLYYYDFVSFL